MPLSKKEHKRLYDIEYRKKNREKIRKNKAAYFQKIYKANPEKFRKERQEGMAKHIEYCRDPEYKRKKKVYDARERHGEFRECYEIMYEIFQIVMKHYREQYATENEAKYQRLKARGHHFK